MRSQRRLWLPFLVVVAVETVFLSFVWLAPHAPFSLVLAPPIRYFFGERVLHYPSHLWFLYHVMPHIHLAASILIGAFMTGLACEMVRQTHAGQPLSLRDALVGRRVRYGRVLLLWLMTWGAAKWIMGVVFPDAPTTTFALAGGIALAMTLQALCVYAIPAAVFERSVWWRALLQGVREAFRHPVSTLLVVAVPSSLVILFSMWASEAQVGRWMVQGVPEIAVAFVIVRLIVWMAADAILTVAIAHLWWFHRPPQSVLARAAIASIPTSSPAVPHSRPTRRPRSRTEVRSRKRPAVGAVATIVCAISVSTIIAGCSTSYTGERLSWRAAQLNALILQDPDRATPEQFAKAIAAFDRVIRKVPGTALSAQAHFSIGSLYVLQRRYDEARDAYALVLERYGHEASLTLAARLAIAQTYQIEERWDEVIRTYQEIAEIHPWSPVGLEAPVRIGALYHRQGLPGLATEAFERAITAYEQLIAHAPSQEQANRVKGHLAFAYRRVENWNAAIATLEELVDASSDDVSRPFALLTLGSIYQAKLQDDANAAEAFTRLISEFPDHPYARVAEARLDPLDPSLVDENPFVTPMVASRPK